VAELDRPYVFRYAEDSADTVAQLLGKPAPVRPVVAVRLSNPPETTYRVVALVDSGSERTFAAPGLARALRLDLASVPEVVIGLGGAPRSVRFVEVTIELFQNLLDDEAPPIAEWRADVGFIREWEPAWAVLLGRDGFFDQFTVTMHGGVPGLAIEPWRTFDERFGTEIDEADLRQPRFRP
jgi:hypothetical protein